MPDQSPTARPIDLRKQQKQANRDAMVAAARALFDSEGFAGTTMELVAARSGMSVQSVYFAFHSKAGLLGAALDQPDRQPDRPPERQLDRDPYLALRQLVDEACRGLETTGGLDLAAAAGAATDPDVAEVHVRREARRAKAAVDVVQRLRARRPLAPGATPRRCADVVYGLLSPELHAVMVQGRGWTSTRYSAWVADAIGHALWGSPGEPAP